MEIKGEKEEKKCLENEREEKRGKIMRSSKERKKRRNAPQLPENGRKCWRKLDLYQNSGAAQNSNEAICLSAQQQFF